ncbi:MULTISPECIES: MFS transporter [Streptomyces]|uniref:MFS transporter n=1 Tax=Streptomyces tricolor TaxID=68277 RepID=A0ABS9JJR6_9ACTN|nr:MFS transporter [Streptomyces tricolor]MCG0065729.1 MFS transporter [Streptomyces tricolor]
MTSAEPSTGTATSVPVPDDASTAERKLPMAALLALAVAVFITSLTETLPAGLLPDMSASLHTSESATGQTVTIYALGTVLTAIPLSAATAGWHRKRLLLTAMAGFAVANTVTALSVNYPLTLVARFVAGVAAGLAWALLAGYARRMVAPHQEGRALAIAMAGIPVALSLGVPAGTFLGQVVSWQAAFLVMTALTVVLLVWIAAVAPDYPGQQAGGKIPMRSTLRVPGVAAVLTVTLVFVLAHTLLYAYIASFLDHIGMGAQVDAALLVFGVACLISIWVVGMYIHRHLRTLTIVSTLLVGVAVAVMGAFSGSDALVYVAAALWGLGWGGVPTLLQTAGGQAGGEAAEAAQAMLVTLWNVAMAGGGIAGGLLLDAVGAAAFPWTVLILLVPVLAIVLASRTHGFPAPRSSANS